MPLQDVLARIPGRAGYLAQQQFDQQQGQSALGQMLGLANFVEQTKQRQMQQQLQQAQLAEIQRAGAERSAAAQRRENAIAGLQQGFYNLFPGLEPIEAPSEELGGGPGRPAVPDKRAQVLSNAAVIDPNSAAEIALRALGMQGQGAGSAGATPMITKILAEAKAAQERGDTEAYALHMENARRLAAGYTPLQLGRYQGEDFGSRARAAELNDQGVGGVPVRGGQVIPGSAPRPQGPLTEAGMRADIQANPPTAPVPGNRNAILQDEADRARARGDMTTVAQIEAEIARSGGGPMPSSMDNAPRPETNLSPRGERDLALANQKQNYETNLKQYSDFRSKRLELNSAVRSLDRLSQLADSGQTFTNAGAEFKMMVSSIGQALGIPLNKEKLASSEEYQAQIAELLKARLGSKDYGSGTAVSNLDLIAAEEPLPRLLRSAAGQKLIIQGLAKDAKERLADISAYNQWFERNRGDMSGFSFPSEALTEQRIKAIQEIDKARGGAQKELSREEKLQFYLRKHANPR